MNHTEKEIIEYFVTANKQERLLWELDSPKRRSDVMWKFADTKFFQPDCLHPAEYMPPKAFEKHYFKLTGSKTVYYMGTNYIGQLTLQQAAQNMDMGDICILYFGNGMGYYQGEPNPVKPPRFFLSK